ncbi:MAG: arylsulfatase [Bacteroidales bacterium]|nr:arylsulfatase [Prevotella sp.]MBQ7238074.1 arylsulfatase [Bacteroidales bacterium]
MHKLQSKQLLLSATAMLPTIAAAQQQAERPNIMLIVVDDMGYSDLGCYGGEINTPNIDGLAENGIRFTQFFNSARSCPSRGSLLTGMYAQQCGITAMGVSLNTQCVTIPEALKTAGYRTAMSGKWHLSLTQGIGNHDDQMAWLSHQNTFNNRPFAPIETYPCNRGFDEHWGTIWGVCNHFDPFSLVHNEDPIYTDAIPDDFYSTDFITQKAIDMLDGLAEQSDPFFMYVSFNAPHWPLHAKPEDIARYKGVYDDGWDVLRTNRYNRMVELGIVDPNETPIAKNESGRAWNDETNKALQSANMEVHAAMVDCIDQGVGRILNELKQKGLYNNTIIIFTSDNGASSENYTIGDFDRHDRTRNGEMVTRNAQVPGDELTYNYLDNGWAGAVNTPFRYWKRESYHGGTAAPTIIHWPAGMQAEKGSIMREPCHFIDVMPTCLELAGANYPKTYNGHTILPMAAEARSLMPLIKGASSWDEERTLFWEHEGGRAVRKGNWRMTSLCSDGKWHLYNLANDYSETTDVAASNPAKVTELKQLWNQWAVSVGINSATSFSTTKSYTILNRNDTDKNTYLQDNDNDDKVVALGTLNDNAYWKFEPTDNYNCFYVYNTATGRYLQSCSTNLQEVKLGDTPVEYYIEAKSAEGAGMYGMASTDQATYDFTGGTIGLNWKSRNDTGRTFDTGQGFAAVAGTNHRSFWKIVMKDEELDDVFPKDKKYTFGNFQDNNYLMKDGRTGRVLVETGQTSNALWQFEATESDNCYYVRNALTDQYMQSTKDLGQPVLTADTPLEIMVVNDPAKGDSYFAFASTDQSNLSFTNDNTFGANWHADGYAQGFQVTLGARPRSFWKVTEIETADFDEYIDNRSAITSAVGAGKNTFVARTLKKDMWNTLVLPHAMNVQAIIRNFGDGALVARQTGETSNGVIHFTTVSEIQAGIPYIVMPTIDVKKIITLNTSVSNSLIADEGNSYDFVGVYAPTAIGPNDYFLAEGNTLKRNTNPDGTLKAFHAYFRSKGEEAMPLKSFNVDGEATGIVDVETANTKNNRDGKDIYTISGQRISKTNKGVYIVGGKKVIVR